MVQRCDAEVRDEVTLSPPSRVGVARMNTEYVNS